MHAGETNKHTGNVASAVDIAEKGVRVRIAHAVNEIHDEKLHARISGLSRGPAPLLSMEFCPDSNIAYNNVQSLHKVPFKRWLDHCKSWFLGSDGSGAIQTDPVQLALSALASGVTLRQLEDLRRREEGFIQERQEAFDKKTAAFHTLYGEKPDKAFLEGMAGHLRGIERYSRLHPFRARAAAGIQEQDAGADRRRRARFMERLRQGRRATRCRACLRLLVATADPAKAYFVVGRTKPEGLIAVLDEEITRYNRDPAHLDKFKVISLNTANATEQAESISMLIPQPGDIDKVAENTIEFMRKSPVHSGKEGLCIFFGGKTFTSDMIKECTKSRMNNYLLMDSAPGASQDWAAKSKDGRKFSNWQTFIPRVAEMLREGMDKQQIFHDSIDPFDHALLSASSRRPAPAKSLPIRSRRSAAGAAKRKRTSRPCGLRPPIGPWARPWTNWST